MTSALKFRCSNRDPAGGWILDEVKPFLWRENKHVKSPSWEWIKSGFGSEKSHCVFLEGPIFGGICFPFILPTSRRIPPEVNGVCLVCFWGPNAEPQEVFGCLCSFLFTIGGVHHD